MSLRLAFKAFFKALKDPDGARNYLEGKGECPEGNHSHLRLLMHLQKGGRFVDFLKEDISQFSDAQVGAAVRQIHSECGRSLEDLITLRPLMNEAEGNRVTIPQGYDPSAIKVVGKVKGKPPYEGILRHKGWRAHKLSLPQAMGGGDQSVVAPAEVEVK